MDPLLFSIAGVFVGIFSGLLGLGGGTVMVPILSFIFSNHMHIPADIEMHMAAGTSLCTMLFTTQYNVATRFIQGNTGWPFFKRMVPFLVLGTISGALLADSISTLVLKKVFGLFMLVIAFYTWYSSKLNKLRPSRGIHRITCFIVGSISGLLGIGGGTMLIPYLTRCRVSMKRSVSISSLCSYTAAIFGTITVLFTGQDDTYHVPLSMGYVYWPAVMWAVLPSILFSKLAGRLSKKLSDEALKRLFIGFLVIVSFKML